jgi:thiamine biosynthesis lipoprotein
MKGPDMADLTRRRFIGIAAVAAGLAGMSRADLARAGVPETVWTGTALGGRASIRLLHPDRAEAERLIHAARTLIARLERVFSLYDPGSALVRLNREGALAAPPVDLVTLLDRARGFSEETGGPFDPTVQPLWRLYAEHFRDDARRDGPSEAAVAAALAAVGWRDLEISAKRIAFARPGMALTLNGIAQGYITDRVAALLAQAGLEHALLDLGEIRPLGRRADGEPWSVGIADPARPGAILTRIAAGDRAVATSATAGFGFDANGRHRHLLDPRTGAARALHASVTVLAADATTADALSTAFSQMPVEAIDAILRRRGDVGVILAGPSGLDRRGRVPA